MRRKSSGRRSSPSNNNAIAPGRSVIALRQISQRPNLPDATLEFVRTILDHGHSENTKRSYRGHLKYFWEWAGEAHGMKEHYPVTVDTVLHFISDHLGTMDRAVENRLIARGIKEKHGPHSLATVTLRLFVLGFAHHLHEAPNPCRDKVVKQVLRNATRAFGKNVKRKRALTSDVLEKVLATCDQSLIGLRDRALILVAFSSGGRRRSELTAFEIRDLTPVEGGYLLRIRRSKTDQTGEGTDVPVLGQAGAAVRAWIKAAKLHNGKLFRAIRSGNRLTSSLGDRQVSRIVKQRIARAGIDSTDFSAHSLRAGFMTSAGRAGIHLGDAMQMSGHRTIEVALRYYRPGSVLNNPAANLLDRTAPGKKQV